MQREVVLIDGVTISGFAVLENAAQKRARHRALITALDSRAAYRPRAIAASCVLCGAGCAG
jgi:hypothetical protein